MSDKNKVVPIKKEENIDFTKLIELINKKIVVVRETIPEENKESYDELISDLYGVIGIYDNWLKETDEEVNKLLTVLNKKRKEKSPIIMPH